MISSFNPLFGLSSANASTVLEYQTLFLSASCGNCNVVAYSPEYSLSILEKDLGSLRIRFTETVVPDPTFYSWGDVTSISGSVISGADCALGCGVVAIDATLKAVESDQTTIANNRQMDTSSFQSFDQTSNQLWDLLGVLVKTTDTKWKYRFSGDTSLTIYYLGSPILTADQMTGYVTPTTPLPATLPLFAGGLGIIGLLGARKRRKAQAA